MSTDHPEEVQASSHDVSATEQALENKLQEQNWFIGRIPRSPEDWLLERELVNSAWWEEKNSWGHFSIGHAPETQAEQELEMRLRALDRKWEVEKAERFHQAELDAVTSRTNSQAERIRGYVVMGVVAALIVSPIAAMALNVAAADFGQFVAPVTGVAGTVIGYWFGNRTQQPPTFALMPQTAGDVARPSKPGPGDRSETNPQLQPPPG